MKSHIAVITGLVALTAAGLAAAPAAAQDSRFQYNHTPGKKGRINESISRKKETAPPTENIPGITSGKTAKDDEYATRLTTDTVRTFINNMQRIATGEAENMSVQDISDYLDRHIAADARFQSQMKYEMPGYPPQQNAMDIGRSEYISGVLNGTSMMDSYEHTVEIKNIEIAGSGRSAKVTTVIREKGEMPWPEDDPNANPNRPVNMTDMPVRGESQCEENIVIGLTGAIQIKGAQCQTLLSFDPFQKDELGDDMFFGR